MTPGQRKEMFDALMAPDQEWLEKFGGPARGEIESINLQTIRLLEPIIDRMMVTAFRAGQGKHQHLTEEEIVRDATAFILTLTDPEIPA